MPRRPARTAALAVSAVVVVAATAGGLVLALGVGSSGSSTRWPVPGPAPRDWHRMELPSGTSMAYPPGMLPSVADPGAASVERRASGLVVSYLNVTPWSGAAPAGGWAAARVDRLGDENLDVRQDAAADGIRFDGAATGSCVVDHYITRAGHHPYREIACLVRSRTGTAVVAVAAAPTSAWPGAERTLRRSLGTLSL